MNIPNEDKKIKISLSIDPKLNNKIEEIVISKKFYKKSRFIEFVVNKYIQDNNL